MRPIFVVLLLVALPTPGVDALFGFKIASRAATRAAEAATRAAEAAARAADATATTAAETGEALVRLATAKADEAIAATKQGLEDSIKIGVELGPEVIARAAAKTAATKVALEVTRYSTSILFWTISRVFLSHVPPRTSRVMYLYSTQCPSIFGILIGTCDTTLSFEANSLLQAPPTLCIRRRVLDWQRGKLPRVRRNCVVCWQRLLHDAARCRKQLPRADRCARRNRWKPVLLSVNASGQLREPLSQDTLPGLFPIASLTKFESTVTPLLRCCSTSDVYYGCRILQFGLFV